MSESRLSMQRLAVRFGWRGLYLMVMGIVWVAVGLAVTAVNAPHHPYVLFQYLPLGIEGGAWVVTGTLAAWVGSRGATDDDSLGHVALYLMPAVRCGSYMVSWLVWAATTVLHGLGGDITPSGYEVGLLAAIIWAAMIALITVCSRWPNPTYLVPHRPKAADDE